MHGICDRCIYLSRCDASLSLDLDWTEMFPGTNMNWLDPVRAIGVAC